MASKLVQSGRSDYSGASGESPTKAQPALKGTVVSSIFILLTTCIGAGTLSLPYAFSQGGIFVFSIIFFLIMVMSLYVGTMLIAGKRYCTEVYPRMEVWSYEDLAYASFGVIGRIASLLTIAVLLFLALIAYMIYTRDQLAAVVQFIVNKHGANFCTPILNCGVLMCIGFLPIFPITLLRKLTPLQFTSYLSIFSISLVAILITIRTILAHTTEHSHFIPDGVNKDISLAPRGFRAVLTVISYCSLSFICHFNLLPLQKELSGAQTKTKLYAIIVGAVVTAYVIYNLVVFSAYFNFYDCIKPDVMLNYEVDDYMMFFARIFLFLTILMHYPVLLHPTRANINGAVYLIYKAVTGQLRSHTPYAHLQSEETSLLRKGTEEERRGADGNEDFKVPMIPWFLETCAIFIATFMLATFIQDVGLVWNFVGSTAGVLVLYVYPSAFYLRLRYVRYRVRANKTGTNIFTQYNVYAVIKEGVALFILVLGLVLLVVENYQAIYAVLPQHGSSSNSTTDTCSLNRDALPTPGSCYTLTCNSSNITNDAGFRSFSDDFY